MKSIRFATLAIALPLSIPVMAQMAGQAGMKDLPGMKDGAAKPAAAAMTEGEVRKIDKAQGKITLKHGEIKNLDMPAMTMTFRAADPKMLDNVKEGDKINFNADKIGGQFTVTGIEKK